MSVCTGAMVYARTGLLEGLDATTHWGSIDALRREAPSANVIENTRFIDNGSVITTAGVSAGIDGALHVVARLLGRDAADQTARYMEYHWVPDETAAVKYSRLNPQLDARGQAMQQADALRQAEDWPAAIKAYEVLTQQYPDDADAWYLLGYCVHGSGDLDRAIELHRKAATFNVRRERPLYNLACAYALKGEADKAFAALEGAIEAGWNSPGFLEQDADWLKLRDDPRFATVVKRLGSNPSQRP
jgi:tetratricopeptide (TPR) repeat protein